MQWRVETLDARVDREVAALSDGLRARIIRLLELVAERGPQALHEPHASHLEGPPWELRGPRRRGASRGEFMLRSGGGVWLSRTPW